MELYDPYNIPQMTWIDLLVYSICSAGAVFGVWAILYAPVPHVITAVLLTIR